MKKKLIVVGGGAAGIMAAIIAASYGAQVTILDHKDRIGSKLLLTGNGKCNLTNLDMKESDYCLSEKESVDFVSRLTEQLPPDKITKFFQSIGMRTTVSRCSYVYPETEAAASVVNVLLRELKRFSVDIRTGVHVKKIATEHDRVLIITEAEDFSADEVILACGGASYPKTGSDGSGFFVLEDLHLKTVSPYPALTAFICSDPGLKALSGLRQNATVRLLVQGNAVAEDYGQVQFTDYGISGIPVFNISSFLIPELLKAEAKKNGSNKKNPDYEELIKKYKNKITAKIDLFPDAKLEELTKLLERQSVRYGDFSFEEAMSGLIHKKWIQYFAHRFSFTGKKFSQLKKEDLILLAKELKEIKFPIIGVKGFDFCQVTGGGLCFSEIREDFSLKKHPHIYAVGELLNITGKCGGYNLHWAFASGMIAGRAAAGVEAEIP